MTELEYTYSDKEYGWVSGIKLAGNIILLISFEENALVTIKQQLEGDKENPKCMISPPNKDFEFTIKKDADNVSLSIIMSNRPKFIKYAYI